MSARRSKYRWPFDMVFLYLLLFSGAGSLAALFLSYIGLVIWKEDFIWMGDPFWFEKFWMFGGVCQFIGLGVGLCVLWKRLITAPKWQTSGFTVLVVLAAYCTYGTIQSTFQSMELAHKRQARIHRFSELRIERIELVRNKYAGWPHKIATISDQSEMTAISESLSQAAIYQPSHDSGTAEGTMMLISERGQWLSAEWYFSEYWDDGAVIMLTDGWDSTYFKVPGLDIVINKALDAQ